MEWINLHSNRYIQIKTNVVGDDIETIGSHIFFASLCSNCSQETIWMLEKLENSQIISQTNPYISSRRYARAYQKNL